jgi:hypothetical protein
MDRITSETIRLNARVFGIALEILSGATLVITFYFAFEAAKFGFDLKIGAVHNPAVWLILTVGIFAAIMLAATGYVFSMLCAIYDRQESESRFLSPPMSPTDPRTTVLSAVEESPSIEPKPKTPDRAMPRDSPPPNDIAKNKLWYQLTRERHFFGK